MEEFNREEHWEKIYQTKALNEVSWYQPKPEISLQLILDAHPSKNDKIIDVGGGDSFLVDHLLDLDFKNVTVLDISKSAIERAKTRLGEKAKLVTWIIADASDFEPNESYAIWHDRAAFHFLTEDDEISNYVRSANKGLRQNGRLIIGTFSENGPLKCSGIEIKQYTEDSMTECFSSAFTKTDAVHVDHDTPFETVQNFVFCSFVKV